MSVSHSFSLSQNMNGPEAVSTLVRVLRDRASDHRGMPAYTFLVDGEDEGLTLTFDEVDTRARAIAAVLQQLGVEGERILLVYPQGPGFIAAFYGCLFAGAIAVPVQPPIVRAERNESLLRFDAIGNDCRPAAILTTAALLPKLEQLVGSISWLSSVRWVATDEIDAQRADQWEDPEVGSARLALLQYTSGSTAAPKGVMVSHRSLLANSDYIDYGFQHDSESVSLNWLPYFHDMGLINGIIQPVFKGFRSFIMSPTSFLQSPFRWLKAISRHGVTHSGGPNFAYELCLRKITPEQRQSLDLSKWAIAFSGAEPVRKDTLESFAAAFAPCGFQARAFYPAYGLAEATLKVTGGRRNSGAAFLTVDADALEKNLVIESTDPAQGGRTLVGCGREGRGTQIVIAHPESQRRCSPNQIGEIWVSGPSVAAGYWNRPEESSKVFEASLAETGEGPFLRTGDLGFLKDGELFVAGRIKDLIIIRGLNHYPQDIELTVERSHPALRRGGGASFSIDHENEERLVVVQEQEFRQEPELQEVVAAIRQAVAENHEVQAYAVVLIKPGTLPKTTSGKVQRRLCRSMFLEGALDVVAEWRAPLAPATPQSFATSVDLESEDAIAEWLGSLLAARMEGDRREIRLDQPIARSGLDSLTAIELLHEIQSTFGVVLSVSDLLDTPSLVVLAREVKARLEAGGLPRLEQGPVDGDFLLSLGQQSLWFLHQLAPQSAAYNISFAARIVFELNVPALHRALQVLVDRHAALRTTFEFSQGRPVQRVHIESNVSFEIEDASSWTDAQLNERLAAESQRAFDLENGPLFRVRHFRRGVESSVLLVVVHHIAADLWSLAILLRDLGVAYSAERKGLKPQFEPVGLQYTDYVGWESKMLASDEGNRQSAYWRRQLSDAPTVLDLPSTRVRPRVQSLIGARTIFTLDSELTDRIKQISIESGATLYMTLLALMQVLIYRYTGRTDFLVGSPTSGRRRQETEGIVGYFVIPLVLRSDLSGDPGFSAILERTRRTVFDALAHDQYPFPLLVKDLQVERDPARSPLFQILFALQKLPAQMEEGLVSFAVGAEDAAVQLGEITLEPIPIEQHAAQFDLSLTMAEIRGKLVGSLEYSVDLFNQAQMERMAEHFQKLIESVVADTERPVSEIPMLTEAERLRLLEWGDTAASYGRFEILHRLFEEQVDSSPDAPALVFQDQAMTYRELNNRANQLAHLLIARGVGPDVITAVLMERSPEMVVSLMGILKAGGAYLPLDPDYPQERLSFMVEDSQPRVLLTQPGFLDLIVARGAEKIALDGNWKALAGISQHNPGVDLAPENLAYVIYTSGTTGQPKGVMNTHRGICNRLLWMQAAYGLTDQDRVLQKTPFTFDVSVWEFFWPLITGARLVVARPGGHQDSNYLADVVSGQEITTLHFVPSMLRVFLENPRIGACTSVRRVICSGEALLADLEKKFFDTFDAQLENLYGPTEAAVDVTRWTCERDSTRTNVPIGRPISNTRIHILDQNAQPVPVEITGELFIAGVGLARGYLNRPDLTAERFIPDPLSDEPGARMYRTGDLARFLSDGEIEYLGRIDHQVKIRGFRIELGEIETALARHSAILESVVVASENSSGDRRLVAYVVPSEACLAELRPLAGEDSDASDESPGSAVETLGAPDTSPVSADNLRNYLSAKVPEYMVPAAFVLMARLPLNSNGKIDRNRLPSPDYSPRGHEYVAPRDDIERELARIFGEVLGVEKIGVEDNFFRLGGHSLLATQVMSRVLGSFEVELPVQQLFETPTVARLSRCLAADASPRSDGISPISRIGQSAREGLLTEIDALTEEQVEGLLRYVSGRTGERDERDD